MDAGTILSALSPSEIDQLSNVDLDVLESLGDYDTFSQEQVNHSIDLFMTMINENKTIIFLLSFDRKLSR